MSKTPGERELEARIADLLVERSRIDSLIEDARAGLRALRGTARAENTQAAQIVALLQVKPLSRSEIGEALGLADLDKLSRMLNYLARGDRPRVRRAAGKGEWEAVPEA